MSHTYGATCLAVAFVEEEATEHTRKKDIIMKVAGYTVCVILLFCAVVGFGVSIHFLYNEIEKKSNGGIDDVHKLNMTSFPSVFCESNNNTVLDSCTDHPLQDFRPSVMAANGMSVALGARLCDERFTAAKCISVNPELLPEYCVPCTQTYRELEYIGGTDASPACDSLLKNLQDTESRPHGDPVLYLGKLYSYWGSCYGEDYKILDVPERMSCPIAESCGASSSQTPTL